MYETLLKSRDSGLMYFISSTKSARYSAFGIHTEQVPASNQAESKQLKENKRTHQGKFRCFTAIVDFSFRRAIYRSDAMQSNGSAARQRDCNSDRTIARRGGRRFASPSDWSVVENMENECTTS